MKIQVVSRTGYGLGIAAHLSSEGHGVNWVITQENYSNIGRGIVSVCTGLPDITIFDDPIFGQRADDLRNEGNRVFGTSLWAQTLQENEEYRQSVIRSIWGKQEPLKGTDIYISTWFNGNNFVSTYLSLVYHRMSPGGTSPDVGFTGCISNFTQPTDVVKAKILDPLCKVLRKVNHRGVVHLRGTVARDLFSLTDFVASYTHPLSLMLFENSKHSVPEILLKLFSEDSAPLLPLNQWATGIMLSLPPFPYTLHSEPTVLEGIIPANLKHLWLADAMRESGKWYTTGTHGKIGYVTARGSTASEAVRRAYRTLHNLKVQSLQYRGDIGKGVNHLLTSLRNSGWIK